MKMFFKILALFVSASLLIFGWIAWSFVHDVTSQHFGAFVVQRFAVVVACIGIASMLFLLASGFPFSRFALAGCALIGVAFSLDSVLNYPPEHENPAYSMVFSPEITDLYFSLAVGISLFLTALLFPKRSKTGSGQTD